MIDTDVVELDELDELEKDDPPPVLLATALLGLIDKTCCVCCEELANWSDILGELELLIPPPPVEPPPPDALELPVWVADAPALLPL